MKRRKMKRIFTLLLSACMLCCLALPAAGAEQAKELVVTSNNSLVTAQIAELSLLW